MTFSTENINALWAKLIVEELVRNGVSVFCISPGSRSAPLTVAAARHPQAETVICYDERGAAFHALGYARATRRAAALICTSGTAAANYYPAVIEASTDHQPMIVISADRPPELRQSGANQTIEQPNLFGRYTRWTFDLPCPTADIPIEMLLTTIDQLCYQAHSSPPGVVHLNCMFREPLAPSPAPFQSNLTSLDRWQNSAAPYTTYHSPQKSISDESLRHIRDLLQSTGRGILFAARLNSRQEADAVLALGESLHWPVYADINSGLRLCGENSPVIAYFDQLLLSSRFADSHQPQTVLQIGGPPVSKRWLQFVTQHPPDDYLLIADHALRQDPSHRLTTRIEADIAAICRQLIADTDATAASAAWLAGQRTAARKVATFLEEALAPQDPLSEISLAFHISREIPEGEALFLASSMPVRDMDMYAAPGSRIVTVAANRGASGIDGTIASAAGFTRGFQKPTTLIIGDLAMIHDLNSLQLLNSLPEPLTIIVVNNQGGGIFSFLPISTAEDIFETHFATPHSLRFETAAAMFGIDYFPAATNAELIGIYRQARQSKNPAIIEVRTNRKQNKALHLQIQNHIAAILNDG